MPGWTSLACGSGGLPARVPGLRLFEERQIDCVAQRVVAKIARVKVVATVVDRQHAGQVVRVAQRPVEVDDRIARSI